MIDGIARLGLAPDADERAIRRAYARELKLIDQEADPEGFQALREAYEDALFDARSGMAGTRGQPQTEAEVEGTPTGAGPTEAPEAEAIPCPPAAIGPDADAAAVFAAFRQRMLSAPFGPEDLHDSLNDPRLINIEARTLFEQHVADLLADSWQPGNETLLPAASSVFGWRDDRRRMRSLGFAGYVLDMVIDERASFDQQPEDARNQQRRLIARLRDDTPPTTRELLTDLPLLNALAGHYPNWLAAITNLSRVPEWRKLQAALPAWRKASHAVRRAIPAFVAGNVSLVIWVTFAIAMFGGNLLHRETPQPAAAPIDYLSQGVDALNHANYKEAIDHLTQAIQLAPKDHEAWAMRAIAHVKNGQPAQARSDLDQSAELNGANALLFRARGLLADEEDRLPDAVDAYTRSLQLEPDHLFTLNQRAYSFYNLKQYDAALADADQILTLAPDFGPSPYLIRIRVAKQRGDKAEATRQVDAMVAAYPQNHHAYLLRALLRPATQKTEKRSDLARALQLHPGSFSAARELAAMDMADHKHGDAAALLSKSLNEASLTADERITLLGMRGIAYTRMNSSTLADSDYASARQLADSSVKLNNLCWLLATSNASLSTALSLCDAALALKPDSRAALDSKGLVLLRLNRPADAIKTYDAALAEGKPLAASLYGRGLSRQKLGDVNGANADLKAARKLDPDVAAELGM